MERRVKAALLMAVERGDAALYLMEDGPRGISLELVSTAHRPTHPG